MHHKVKTQKAKAEGDEHPKLTGKTPYLHDNDKVSTLTIGGTNPDHYTGDITWHDTSASTTWDLKADFISMSSKGFIMNDSDGDVNVQF